jgi:hypothetical protein
MITVHKVPLTDVATSLPIGPAAVPLLVAMQHGKPHLWLQVDNDEKHDRQLFVEIVGTGGPVPEAHRYLSTFFDGLYVWHVYWRIPKNGSEIPP